MLTTTMLARLATPAFGQQPGARSLCPTVSIIANFMIHFPKIRREITGPGAWQPSHSLG